MGTVANQPWPDPALDVYVLDPSDRLAGRGLLIVAVTITVGGGACRSTECQVSLSRWTPAEPELSARPSRRCRGADREDEALGKAQAMPADHLRSGGQPGRFTEPESSVQMQSMPVGRGGLASPSVSIAVIEIRSIAAINPPRPQTLSP